MCVTLGVCGDLWLRIATLRRERWLEPPLRGLATPKKSSEVERGPVSDLHCGEAPLDKNHVVWST